MKPWLLLILLSASLSVFADSPKLLAVKFHADWCGSCKTMGSVFEDLQNKLDGESLVFVTLDKTNKSLEHQAELMAGALGIQEAYTQHQGTGFILLIDAKTKKVIAKMTKEHTFKEMTTAMQQQLHRNP